MVLNFLCFLIEFKRIICTTFGDQIHYKVYIIHYKLFKAQLFQQQIYPQIFPLLYHVGIKPRELKGIKKFKIKRKTIAFPGAIARYEHLVSKMEQDM